MIEKPYLLRLMNESEAVWLATVGTDGPSIRALVNLRRADLYPGPAATARTDDFTVYLSTSRASAKVREIEADPRVSLYYCTPARFEGVTLNGTAGVSEDETLRRALWHESWRIYWPDGAGNQDYVILKIVPKAIFGWHGSEAFDFKPEMP
jgi:general stress protein 26